MKQLTGLHHITAVTSHASENVRFYTQALGMRMVKKTVNQDDLSAYHLFYGDEIGNPGTELTFFDWKEAPRRRGTGTLSESGLRVSDASALEWWRERFDSMDIQHGEIVKRNGRASLPFQDFEDQRLALVAEDGEAQVPGGNPWDQSPVPVEVAIRGLDHVTLTLRQLEPTERVFTEVLGFERVSTYTPADNEGHEIIVYTTGAGGPGTEMHVEVRPDLPPGTVGRGGVHHVAFRTPDDETHRWWQKHLTDAGIGVTDVIDRFYFRSLYFRVPGGVLFEIATDGPGFATDEDPQDLGKRLSLPPFLESRRAEIEAGLRPLSSPELSGTTK
ncbi:MAG: ring-cleaving dioxygenase [Armatimonadetes bacterium]|nr:ring-cleaving dioxygenase [Armatimonadota bacterium]